VQEQSAHQGGDDGHPQALGPTEALHRRIGGSEDTPIASILARGPAPSLAQRPFWTRFDDLLTVFAYGCPYTCMDYRAGTMRGPCRPQYSPMAPKRPVLIRACPAAAFISTIAKRESPMASEKIGLREEFRIVITGLRLTDEQRDKLDAAIQQAALRAVSDLDFGGDQASVIFPLSAASSKRLPDWADNLGTTRGLWIGELPDESLQRWLQSQ
jgi:hypothetical protein